MQKSFVSLYTLSTESTEVAQLHLEFSKGSNHDTQKGSTAISDNPING